MINRMPYNDLFLSTTAETTRRIEQSTFSLDKDITPDDVRVLRALTPFLPIMQIFGGANAETIQAIPDCFYKVILRLGANENISSHLPAHISTAEIYNDAKPGAVANMPDHVKYLVFSGPTIELLKSIPKRYSRIYLRNDITPQAMASIPETVSSLVLLGPISAEALRRTPPSVEIVHFNNKSFRWLSYKVGKTVINPGKQLLASLPENIRTIGVSDTMNQTFLQCLPERIKYLIIEINNSPDFAAAIPRHIRKVLVRSGVSTSFIDAIPTHIQVICSGNASPQMKANVAERERQRQARLSVAANQKRPAQEALDLDSESAPAPKKARISRK